MEKLFKYSIILLFYSLDTFEQERSLRKEHQGKEEPPVTGTRLTLCESEEKEVIHNEATPNLKNFVRDNRGQCQLEGGGKHFHEKRCRMEETRW